MCGSRKQLHQSGNIHRGQWVFRRAKWGLLCDSSRHLINAKRDTAPRLVSAATPKGLKFYESHKDQRVKSSKKKVKSSLFLMVYTPMNVRIVAHNATLKIGFIL